MKISARNQFSGKVVEIEEGSVNSIVKIEIAAGNVISATISKDAVEDLGISKGKEIAAIIKATEVMVGKGDLKISARNKFPGKVSSIIEGAVNSKVTIETFGSNKITATISNDAVKELELSVGSEAVGIVKATSVLLAV